MWKKDKMLEIFFERPNGLFKIMEISRLTKPPKTTAVRRLDELFKKEMVLRKKETVKGFIANKDTKELFNNFIKGTNLVYKNDINKKQNLKPQISSLATKIIRIIKHFFLTQTSSTKKDLTTNVKSIPGKHAINPFNNGSWRIKNC